MPQSWIVRGLKQANIGSSENSHLKMNEKRLRNQKKNATFFQRAKRAKLPLFIVIYAMQISDVLAAVIDVVI